MNRLTASLLSALEAFIVVAIGVFIPLVPLTVLWGVQYGFTVDWMVFWRAACDIWLLGNGVDLTVTLDEATLQVVGIKDAAAPFAVTIAPLAFALFTVLMGVRTGRRAGRTAAWLQAGSTSVVVFALASGAIGISAVNAVATPSLLQAFCLPALVWLLGLAIGTGIELVRADESAEPLLARLSELRDRVPRHVEIVLLAGLRGASLAVAATVAAAAVTVAAGTFLNFSTVVSLYQASQLGVIGGIVVTIGQIAFMPNIVIWALAWFTGSGFSLGTGSTVAPAGTVTGPVPGIPLLGVLPNQDFTFGFLGLAVPIIAGFLAAVAVRKSVLAGIGGRSNALWLAVTAVVIGVIAGIQVLLLAWWSGGAAGPGRFVEIGPAPFAVGGLAAVLVAVGCLIGMASGSAEHSLAHRHDERAQNADR
ncbi:hypothetical protein SAMN04489806_0356 [Paramicrobacterium humi]|uniref:Uncharacterized protein n=1 Tax=Paramicrobacterium humi TaxID=640635 RepID=A0A1H4IXI4_9MICO|nr:DUF6350 family protein [Microbacterium humi]SEB38821.1 hypothetical protein SAMN04489806_0356 [Microbacterium humi]